MKERLLAELNARIARHVAGDSSGVLDEQALALVAELAALGEPDAASLERVAALHLSRYQALTPEHGQVDLRLARAIFTKLHTVDPRLVSPQVREFFGFPSPHDSGVERLREYERTGRPGYLERAISLFRQELVEQRTDRGTSLNSLGMALLRRFELTAEPSDVDEAVAVLREAVATTADHPDHAKARSTLAVALTRRFDRTRQPADLDEAVALGRAATSPPTGSGNRAPGV